MEKVVSLMEVEKQAVVSDCLIQAKSLLYLHQNGLLENLLMKFRDYPAFIAHRTKKRINSIVQANLKDNKRQIVAAEVNDDMREIFYIAHIAACCELFHEWEIPIRLFNEEDLLQYVKEYVSTHINKGSKEFIDIKKRVSRADAQRTNQILRLLGLITQRTRNIRQLSIAAGNGSREINGMHSVPGLEFGNSMHGNGSKQENIKFHVDRIKTKHTVLIDNDPQFYGIYQEFNSDPGNDVLALNSDCYDALSSLAGATHAVESRNMILGLRIDHLIFDDIDRFFSLLAPLLLKTADLVITIGAGHTLDEYRGRVEKVRELFEYLEKIGLNPLQINLHKEGMLEEQRNQPSFGYFPFATYEILYCKLQREVIEKACG